VTQNIRRRARDSAIALDYRNARGETVQISDAVLSDLLTAVGAGTGTIKERQRAAPLPPVLVVTPLGQSLSIRVFGMLAGSEVAWHLELEDGTVRTGRSVIAVDLHLTIDNVPHGYHKLALPDWRSETTLIVSPGQCWLPDNLSGERRTFGVSLQIYLLQSKKNFGIGDFGDLSQFASLAGSHGCNVIGVNPLHQMFLDAPERASPYSPVSRYFLNILYIDLQALPEWPSPHVQKVISNPGFTLQLERCRAAPLVDYAAVTSLKLAVLRAAFSEFEFSADQARRVELAAFVQAGGARLRSASVFQVLRSQLMDHDNNDRAWKEQYLDPSSDAVLRFAEQHRDEVAFLSWTQWVADKQLAKVAEACADAGMTIGIYRDLAVGCDRAGAETWSEPECFLKGVSVGAPPDILNPAGQNWGLPPFNPVALREQAYRPFRDLVRANMRHAGGLRIDHVMGLQRLYCIPDGKPASEGAYIEYPLNDLLGVIALESHRNHCIVVGEDLGTVPEGFRERLADANILLYRVVMFEQNDTGFIKAEDYPVKAVAVAGSHDMATLSGWFAATDIDLKERLGLYPNIEEVTRQRHARQRETTLLETVLSDNQSGLTNEQFIDAMHGFLGRTRSALAIAQLDDLIYEAEPVNVPGTTCHPNWRRKYGVPLEDISDDHPAWHHLAVLTKSGRERQLRCATRLLDP
jgi:4-alpha-glucanotransferase